jgi:hypothetical protein
MRLNLGTDVEDARFRALGDLRAATEAAREKLLPAGEKHAVQMAHTEACDFLKSGEPGPWIEAEMKAMAATGARATEMAAAGELMGRYARWLMHETRLHEIARTAELRILAATRVRDIQTIMAGLTWPSP